MFAFFSSHFTYLNKITTNHSPKTILGHSFQKLQFTFICTNLDLFVTLFLFYIKIFGRGGSPGIQFGSTVSKASTLPAMGGRPHCLMYFFMLSRSFNLAPATGVNVQSLSQNLLPETEKSVFYFSYAW